MLSFRQLAALTCLAGTAMTAVAQRTYPVNAADKVGCDPGPTCPPVLPGTNSVPFGCANLDGFEFGEDDVLAESITLQACAVLASSTTVWDWGEIENGGDISTGLGTCYVDEFLIINAEQDCSLADSYLLYFTDGPIPSALPRRRHEIRRQIASRDVSSVCPSGLSACRVEGSNDGYECLDTATELESCGGCRFGVFEGPTPTVNLPVKLPKHLRKPQADPKPRRNVRAMTVEAEVTIGLDCSDRSVFGADMTCQQGACVPAA